ncbi:Gfo/Idh/MocA family protein [Galbibacter pacificus]|uniref:Gfo/Idh/MocA family oxidoreductase n=1 Tax=Galbibacter pacificus TaxID=2996052 RepID=A0ABT6FSE2_9FLAO|nr:Gfo/Idh/MocA family oxidoreductase [Galbibacter pacificus]MDG3582716.1 Gfo/Idh/MocA family oxidoreductase [Galbibacter pacificus]MDG3586165.1 Gfo/Idh/MocA family oxidoreductase [Galbibacter pacificus]
MKRRNFIKNAAAAGSALYIVPSHVMGGVHVPPSDTLYMAGFGVGGRGGQVIKELGNTKKVKFVTLCDVDEVRAKDTFKAHPKAKKYKDFREVYDKHLNEIDAFMVATPDHNHATIALPFMKAKKHAYVEKPLTHNIAEARLMAKVAQENSIVTQMGNQGSSSDGARTTQEWIEAGVIGKVIKVDCWTNRPVWPQGTKGRPEGVPVPGTLDWDQWLGPAAFRPYNPAYLPFKWRGWWDFGTGALGDMGCHIMETPFRVLKLNYPTEAEASCTTVWSGDFVEADYSEACPPSSIVRLKFNTENHGDIALSWYDGGIMPDIPDGLQEGETIGDPGGGSIFYGEKGILITDAYSENPRILNAYKDKVGDFPTEKRLKRIDGAISGHYNNFVDGCLKGIETSSPFSYAGPLTETVLMGNLAIKAFQYKVLKPGKKIGDWDPYDYPGRKKIMWDGKNMRVTNYEKANEWINGSYRKGWELSS